MAICPGRLRDPTTTPTPTPMAARETATTDLDDDRPADRHPGAADGHRRAGAHRPPPARHTNRRADTGRLALSHPTERAKPGRTRQCAGVGLGEVVADDPALDHPDVPGFEGIELGPYVEARDASGRVMAQGYAMTGGADMAFADLDGDGDEEAAVQLFSGGTAGNTGLLVYKISGGLPAAGRRHGRLQALGPSRWTRAAGDRAHLRRVGAQLLPQRLQRDSLSPGRREAGADAAGRGRPRGDGPADGRGVLRAPGAAGVRGGLRVPEPGFPRGAPLCRLEGRIRADRGDGSDGVRSCRTAAWAWS